MSTQAEELMRASMVPFIATGAEGEWSQLPLTDFRLVNTLPEPRPATEKTEAFLRYGTAALWLRIVAWDSQIDRLNKGVPDEPDAVDNPLEWTGDVIEVFVQTADDEPIHHFAFNPNGARWDSGPGGVAWNGRWQVKTEILEDRWESIVRIPFTDLQPIGGGFRGTPASGSTWRGNVCRVHKRLAEFSTWSPTQKGFGNRAHFGALTFGERIGHDLTIQALDTGAELGLHNRLQLRVQNNGDQPRRLRARFALASPGAAEPQLLEAAAEPAAGEQTTLTLGDYALEPVGDCVATLTLTVDDEEWILAERTIATWPLPASLAALREFTRRSEAHPAQLREDPELSTVGARIASLHEGAAELARLHAAKAYIEAVALAERLMPELRELDLLVANQVAPLLWRRTATGHGTLATGIMSASDKFFHDEPFRGIFTTRIAMLVAGNEAESAQIVLFPNEPVDNVIVEWSALNDATGNPLGADLIECHLVGDVWVSGPYSGRPEGRFWPDVLLPQAAGTPFALERPSAVMLTVRAPAGQAPGTYRGEWRLKRQGTLLARLELQVEVLPFSLPEPGTFRSDWWVSEHHVRGIYGQGIDEAFYAKLAETLGRYRMAPQLDRGVLLRHLDFTRRTDGTFAVDCTRLAPFVRIEVEAGRTHWNLGFEGSRFPNVLQQFARLPVRDEATGESAPAGDAAAEAMLRAYLTAMTEQLTTVFGIPPERLYCSLGDEPWDESQKADLRRFGELVAQATPAKRLAAGTHPGMGLDDVIDTWVPQIRQHDPAHYPPGSEVHWYTCLDKAPLPNMHIVAAGVDPRIQAWLAWKDGVTGFLYWSSIYWGTSDQYIAYAKAGGRSDEQRWVNPNWPQPFANQPFPGDATFFYPAPDGVVPTLRAQAYRDGIDDYDYLERLDALHRQHLQNRGKLPEPVNAMVRDLLQLPAEVAQSTRHWTHSGETLDRYREQIARAIVLLQRLQNEPAATTLDLHALGVVGDGIADDTIVLQYAIADAVRRGATLFIPRGIYRITAPLKVPMGSYSIRRAVHITSDWATILADHPMPACLDIDAASHLTIERLHLDGNGMADVGFAGFKISGRQAVISQVTVRGTRDAGFRLEKCQGATFRSCAAAGNRGVGWELIDCNAAVLDACGAQNNGSHGFVIRAKDFSAGCTLHDLWSESNGGDGVRVVEGVASPVVLRDGWLEGNGGDGVRLAGKNAVVTGLGVTGSGNGENRAIRLTATAAGCYVHGCFVQNGPGSPNYAHIRVEGPRDQLDQRHRVIDNFGRYRGNPVQPELAD